MSNYRDNKQLEKIHEEGENLMSIYRSRAIPIQKLIKIAEIINIAYELGKGQSNDQQYPRLSPQKKKF